MFNSKEHIEKEVILLARNTENKLRAAQWGLMVRINLNDLMLCNGGLLIVGAILTFIIPNLRDLLDVIDLFSLKVGIIIFLLSALLGLFAKFIHKDIDEEIGDTNKYGEELGCILKEHAKEFKELEKKAETFGFQLKDEIDFKEMFKPLDTLVPNSIKEVAKEIFTREKDPDRKWRSAFWNSKKFSYFVYFQLVFLVMGVSVLLIALKEPVSLQ